MSVTLRVGLSWILLPAPQPCTGLISHCKSPVAAWGTIPACGIQLRSMLHVEMAFGGFRGGWGGEKLPVSIQIRMGILSGVQLLSWKGQRSLLPIKYKKYYPYFIKIIKIGQDGQDFYENLAYTGTTTGSCPMIFFASSLKTPKLLPISSHPTKFVGKGTGWRSGSVPGEIEVWMSCHDSLGYSCNSQLETAPNHHPSALLCVLNQDKSAPPHGRVQGAPVWRQL